jgi:mRNA-degrading endonuclease RelE of RelBE toxin-antitoxin system
MKTREKYLSRLPKETRAMILAGLYKIVSWDTAFMDIKKIVGKDNEYRRKPNKQLRVIYTNIDGNITIEKIWPRGDIYA